MKIIGKSKINFKNLNFLFCIFIYQLLSGQGGMWLPSEISDKVWRDMKKSGFELSKNDIYNEFKPSIKDAVVQFGGGCTGAIISENGLLLTNHHCGYGAIQRLSDINHNYLEDGYWADAFTSELPAAGVTATFIDSIRDITNIVLQGVSDDMTIENYQSLIDLNINAYKNKIKLEANQSIEIKPFYNGNKYYLFIKKMYQDVRLVGAPPESVGKFGGETDNWQYPRHNADFSLFRIYADKNNNPASYSTENIPFKPKKYLLIDISPLKKGDFTLVYGFPGSTDEYLPSTAIDQIANKIDPANIEVRALILNILDKYMKNDPVFKLKYANKYSSIANAYKKWIGESQGLIKANVVAKRAEFENDFNQHLKKNLNLNVKYKDLISDYNKFYLNFEHYNIAQNRVFESFGRNIDLFNLVMQFVKLENFLKNNGQEAYENEKKKLIKRYQNTDNIIDIKIDKEIFNSIIKNYIQKTDIQFIPKSLQELKDEKEIDAFVNKLYSGLFFDKSAIIDLLQQTDYKDIFSKIRSQPAYQLIDDINQIQNTKISSNFNYFSSKIDSIQRIYLKALKEVYPENSFFPDANGTLRFSFGKIDGFNPRDGVSYKAFTSSEGLKEKYVKGDYDFDLPDDFKNLIDKSDFGKYSGKNGTLPLCFIGTNHTTGGNSGSPVINGKGRLIGLNFDRVWEGTMSDIYYDPKFSRNIMVNMRYILFVIEKYGKSKRLIDELKIANKGIQE